MNENEKVWYDKPSHSLMLQNGGFPNPPYQIPVEDATTRTGFAKWKRQLKEKSWVTSAMLDRFIDLAHEFVVT